jgi:hypothetical protein
MDNGGVGGGSQKVWRLGSNAAACIAYHIKRTCALQLTFNSSPIDKYLPRTTRRFAPFRSFELTYRQNNLITRTGDLTNRKCK